MNLETFLKWVTENKISFESDIESTREIETMYDKGFIPATLEEFEFFEKYIDIKPIVHSFKILYKNNFLEISFYDNGTDLLTQCKNEIEKAIKDIK